VEPLQLALAFMTKPILDFGFWIGRRTSTGIYDAVGLFIFLGGM
jgi:hypothetical protein